jgi:uncharacterized DUF497 family protein
MSLTFEWDRDKSKRNLKKHGVSFEEASTIFADPLARTIHDPLHSEQEDRYVSVGESRRQRILVVVFTERGDNIRIISARVATRRERKDREEVSEN